MRVRRIMMQNLNTGECKYFTSNKPFRFALFYAMLDKETFDVMDADTGVILQHYVNGTLEYWDASWNLTIQRGKSVAGKVAEI